MAWSLLRYANKSFNKQLRQCHRSAITRKVSTFDVDKEKKAFQDILPGVMDSLITGPILSPLPEVGNWVKQLLEYTMSGGSLNKGLTVSLGYRVFEDHEHFSEDTQHSARVLGWCLEMLQAYVLVVDDMIDGGTTRRGKPCWYLHQQGSPSAINDSVLIYLSTMELLESNFGKRAFYSDLMRLINQTVYKASIGEHLDCASSYNKNKDTTNIFTMDHYNTIVLYKTGIYWYRLPILAALLLVKNGKDKATEELNYICLELGRYFQIQDDYVDTYGNETLAGKTGRDIQEGKCSWLAVTALQQCNETQRSIFKEFYGSKDPENVKRIKQLYDELNLPQIYKQYERTVYHDLVRRIHALPNEGETKFLMEMLNACYNKRLN